MEKVLEQIDLEQMEQTVEKPSSCQKEESGRSWYDAKAIYHEGIARVNDEGKVGSKIEGGALMIYRTVDAGDLNMGKNAVALNVTVVPCYYDHKS